MEMLTNCVIFNDGAHRDISDPEVRADRTIILRQGEKNKKLTALALVLAGGGGVALAVFQTLY